MRPGVLIKTLSHIWGKLNLPTLLLRVGLLTLIKMDSLIYLDKCETIDGFNSQGANSTPAATREVKSKGHIVIPYTQGLC